MPITDHLPTPDGAPCSMLHAPCAMRHAWFSLSFFSFPLCPPACVFHNHDPRTFDVSHRRNTDAIPTQMAGALFHESIRKNLPVSQSRGNSRACPWPPWPHVEGDELLQRWGVEMSVGASRCLGAPGQSGEAAPLSFLRAWVQLTELLNSTPNIAQSADDLLLEP